MPKFYSSFHIIRILKKHGFLRVSQKGSHIKYRKFESSVLTVIIPANKKEIPIGTFKSILRQARLEEKNFE